MQDFDHQPCQPSKPYKLNPKPESQPKEWRVCGSPDSSYASGPDGGVQHFPGASSEVTLTTDMIQYKPEPYIPYIWYIGLKV